MLRQGLRVSSRGVMPLLIAAALLAPFVPAGALADCCALEMPCCPERMAAPQGAPAAMAAALGAPVPACCQSLLPAGAPQPSDRQGTPAAPAPIGVPFQSPVPEVALLSAGRVLSFETAPAENPPRESRSARAPPIV